MRNTTPLVACLLIKKSTTKGRSENESSMYRMGSNARNVSMTTGHRAHNYSLHFNSALLYCGQCTVVHWDHCWSVYTNALKLLCWNGLEHQHYWCTVQSRTQYGTTLQPCVSHSRVEGRLINVRVREIRSHLTILINAIIVQLCKSKY
jgi:hypothetical protein